MIPRISGEYRRDAQSGSIKADNLLEINKSVVDKDISLKGLVDNN